jgi:hypothetical protein
MNGWETARRLRAREAGATSLAPMPIIMVSANAFENQADKLAEAGAQAFVDKPVIESELLVALQRHLQLEWVAELKLPGWAPPEPATEALPLPAEQAATLLRLARLGHARGLHEALDQLGTAHAALLPQVTALRALVDRFAFGELLVQLQRAQAAQAADDDHEEAA